MGSTPPATANGRNAIQTIYYSVALLVIVGGGLMGYADLRSSVAQHERMIADLHSANLKAAEDRSAILAAVARIEGRLEYLGRSGR